jgi:hypothetical protein
MAADELRAAASSFPAFLLLSLSDQVEGWYRADLQDCWLDVLMHRPPWSDLQLVEAATPLEQHHQGSQAQGTLIIRRRV